MSLTRSWLVNVRARAYHKILKRIELQCSYLFHDDKVQQILLRDAPGLLKEVPQKVQSLLDYCQLTEFLDPTNPLGKSNIRKLIDSKAFLLSDNFSKELVYDWSLTLTYTHEPKSTSKSKKFRRLPSPD